MYIKSSSSGSLFSLYRNTRHLAGAGCLDSGDFASFVIARESGKFNSGRDWNPARVGSPCQGFSPWQGYNVAQASCLWMFRDTRHLKGAWCLDSGDFMSFVINREAGRFNSGRDWNPARVVPTLPGLQSLAGLQCSTSILLVWCLPQLILRGLSSPANRGK